MCAIGVECETDKAYSGFPAQAAVRACVWERVEKKESQRARGKADWHFSII